MGLNPARTITLIASLTTCTLALTGCSILGESPEPVHPDVEFVTIAAGGTSGPYYQIGAGLSQILKENLGSISTVQATGASVENIQLITTGRAEIAFAMGDATRQAIEGNGPFEGRNDLNDLKAITALYPNYVQIVSTKDAEVSSVDDLRGKRVGVGDINSGVELNAQMILESYGMSYDDIDEDFLSYGDAIDQMKNGQIDAAFVTSGIPNSSVMDLATSAEVVIVPIEGEGLNKLRKEYPFFEEATIPGGTYDQTEDVTTTSITNQLLVPNDLSEDAAYLITKTIFENLDELYASHNAAKKITLDSVKNGLATELHPGALKYYKEQGVL